MNQPGSEGADAPPDESTLAALWEPILGPPEARGTLSAGATFKPAESDPPAVAARTLSKLATLSGGTLSSGGTMGGTLSAGGTMGGPGEHPGAASPGSSGAGTGGPADSYEVVSELGRGGMGVVWRGRQRSLRREVAIKTLHPGAGGAGAREKFVSEALVTGLLDHPNIVPVHDLGLNPDGSVFLAMKLVGGRSWDRLLHPETDEDKLVARGFGLVEHLRTLITVSNAVAFAHSNGILHRDLKPENVMVGEFGEVLLMDWGIAVDIMGSPDKDTRAPHKSTVRGPAGTPSYMAPEMAEGEGDKLAPQTDVYLLGAILHELLTGRPPHTGASLIAVLLAASRSEPPQLGADVPAPLAEICRKAMARRPADRYRNAGVFKTALEQYLRHRESLEISARAEQELATLEQAGPPSELVFSKDQRAGRYETFATVIARFSEALELWSENAPARTGLRRARLACARLAFSADDLGLAGAQLSRLAGDSEAASLAADVEARRAALERERASAARLRNLVRVLAVILVIGLGTGAGVFYKRKTDVAKGRDAANAAEQKARSAAEAAKSERERADKAREQAEAAAREAADRLAEARAAAVKEAEQRKAAEAATERSQVARREALDASAQAELRRAEAEQASQEASAAIAKADKARAEAARRQREGEIELAILDLGQENSRRAFDALARAAALGADSEIDARMEILAGFALHGSRRPIWSAELGTVEAKSIVEVEGELRVLAGALSAKLHRFEAQTGRLLSRAAAESDKPAEGAARFEPVGEGRVSPNGELLVRAEGRRLTLRPAKDKRKDEDLPEDRLETTAPVVTLAFLSSRLLATVDESGRLDIWSVESGPTKLAVSDLDELRTTAVSPDERLALVSRYKGVEIYDVATGRRLRVQDKESGGARFVAPHLLELSPMTIVDPCSGEVLRRSPEGVNKNEAGVWLDEQRAVAFLPAPKDRASRFRVFDLSGAKSGAIQRLPRGATAIGMILLSPDRLMITAGGNKFQSLTYDTGTWKVIKRDDFWVRGLNPATMRYIAYEDGTTYLRDYKTGETLGSRELPSSAMRHGGDVLRLVRVPGTTLAIEASDGDGCQLSDFKTGERIVGMPAGNKYSYDASISEGGGVLTLTAWDSGVRILRRGASRRALMLADELEGARRVLADKPRDPEALSILAEWCELNGAALWALDLYERSGRPLAPLKRARLLWVGGLGKEAAVIFLELAAKPGPDQTYFKLCAEVAGR